MNAQGENVPICCEPLESRRLLSVSLVRDVNPATASATISDIETLGSTGAVFWTERGVWKSDGTTGGTVLLRNGFYQDASPAPQLTNVGGNSVYFTARESSTGAYELWRTDGTSANTVKIVDSPAAFTSLSDVAGTLYYATANAGKTQLWKQSGSGTPTLVKEFTGSSVPSGMTGYGGNVYFSCNAAEGAGLWITDGTTAGTTLFKAIATSVRQFSVANGLLYFAANDGQIGDEPWRTDGTVAGTFMLKDVAAGSASSSPQSFTPVANGGVVFIANSNLYFTDGTAAKTAKLTTISSVAHMVRLGNAACFTGYDTAGAQNLYRTDGTTAGTSNISTVWAFGDLAAANDRIYFIGNVTGSQWGIWKSNGTAAGTVLVTPLTALTPPILSGTTSGNAFFRGTDALYGTEVFVTDGTTAGTFVPFDTNPTPVSGNPGGVFPASSYWAVRGDTWTASLGNTNFFNVSGNLWKTDGTNAGTVPVKQDFPPSGSSPAPLKFMTAWNGAVYFVRDLSSGYTLWRSDGTYAGTTMLKTIDFGPPSGAVFVPFNGYLYFLGYSSLWRTDGTAAGTVNLGVSLPYPDDLTVAGSHLFFRAGWDSELWMSDGTAAGTAQLKDINPGSSNSGQSSYPDELVNMNGILYFTAKDNSDDFGRGLWKSDGTPAGTVPVMRQVVPTYAGTSNYTPCYLTPIGNTLFFAGFTWSGGWELWKSDGTSAGTVEVKEINTTSSGSTSSSPRWITAGPDGRAYFAAYLPQTGTELWVSDGTAGGTQLIRDVQAGAGSSISPAGDAEWPLISAGNSVFFVADDGANGSELWQTCGTWDTTSRVTDLQPGVTPSNPHVMSVISPPSSSLQILFSADSLLYGRELFSAGAAAAPAAPPSWLSVGPGAAYSLMAESLSVSAGTVSLIGDAALTHPKLDVTISAGAQLILDANETIRTLSAAAGGKARIQPGGGRVLRVNQISLQGGAQVDVGDAELLIDYSGATIIGSWNGSAYTGITGLLASGCDGGAWDGSGIVTSMSAATGGNSLTTLAVAEAADVLGIAGAQTALWNGQTVDATTIIVKYTYAGDANLDGIINGDDYFAIDSSFPQLLHGYYYGDFNFDGSINGDDYFLIDSNFPQQGSPL